ncbi:MAG: EAL domain-containing protein [Ferrovum sp.]|nr:EAL domain-containing protein [Ferrovum sp.]
MHQLRLWLRMTVDGVHIIDRQGILVEASDFFCAMLGYARTEAIGMHVSQWDCKWTSAEVMAVVEHNFQLGEGAHHTFETLHRCKDGRIISVEVTAQIYYVQRDRPLLFCSSRDITVRKQLESALRFKQFGISRAGEQMFWINRQGRIVDVNESACRQLGYDREELLQMTVGDIDAQFPFETWPEHWVTLKQQGTLSFESMQRRRDGSIFPTEIVANFFEFEGSEYNCSMVRDISLRKENQRRIEQLSNLYHALSEINQAIVRMDTKDNLFPLVCRMAVEYAGFAMAWIGQVSTKRDRVVPVVWFGEGTQYLEGISLPLQPENPEDRGPAARAFCERKTVFVNDFQKERQTAHWHERAQPYKWGSSATFPIIQAGSVVAVFGVYAVRPHAFDEDSVAILDEMVRDIAFALESFDRDQARRQAEMALMISERHFRAYFERSMVGMAATSKDKRWIEVNPALCSMLGYDSDELKSMTWDQLTHPDDLPGNRQLFMELFQGKIDEYELDKRFFRKDGTVLFAHVAARAVRDGQGRLDYLVALVEDITRILEQKKELERQVYYDILTGLPNRALLTDRLNHALAQIRRSHGAIAVCFMDLDGFKQVNDRCGHGLGDLLLVEVAQRVRRVCRSNDTVARFGGDEFVVIIEGIVDRSECQFLLERIMEVIAQPFKLEGQFVQISASIGVTLCPEDLSDGETLLRHADQAMYLAKQAGRNRYCFFDAQSENLNRERHHTLDRIAQALSHGELLLYYQPKVDMRNGQVVGAEALIRWQDPERGLVLPGGFIPVIEGSSLEITLSEWVVKEALKQLSVWASQGFQLTLSVNIPANHLQSQGFVEFITQAVAAHPELSSNALELEVLETVALGDLDSAIQKMVSCIDAGVGFAIDDFGTGYASLAYLRRLPAETIKIDQVFVRDMLHDAEDMSIVRGVIGLAEAFQKQVIAEGVESVEQGTKLLEMGCQLAQGFGIARPMPSSAFPTWMRSFRGFPEVQGASETLAKEGGNASSEG